VIFYNFYIFITVITDRHRKINNNVQCFVYICRLTRLSGVSATTRRQCGFLPQLDGLSDWIWRSYGRILARWAEFIM